MMDTELSRIYCETRGVTMAENEGEPQSHSEPRRSFTEEFKREAVRLAIERGNVSAVARDLGINESVLNRCVCASAHRWKRQLQQETARPGSQGRPFPGRGNARDEELAKIQRENARLKQENEILKKAVGIFTSRPA